MFALIGAVVAAIAGIVGKAIGTQNDWMYSQKAREEASINYEYNKTLLSYNMLSDRERQQLTIAAILIIGVVITIIILAFKG